MNSVFEQSDRNLSSFVEGRVVKNINHIDKDACIQITFSDNSLLIIDAMIDSTTRSGALPTLNFIDIDGEYVEYWSLDEGTLGQALCDSILRNVTAASWLRSRDNDRP